VKAVFLVGRLVFGGYFMFAGVNHFTKRKMGAGYAAAKNVPQPDAAVIATGALLLAGGASIVLGLKPKLGALALVTFLAVVSPVMHDFWNSQDPMQRQFEMVHFMQNLALLGGALALAGVEEPWPVSLPVWRPSPNEADR
jgi:putative oxidoreductase